MELRQLRQLLVLAETRNFHRAATALNMAQPPLSVSIRKLEEDLGVRLFERHARGITLTSEGEFAASQAAEILRIAGELKQFASEAAVRMRGPLNLGFVASATYDVIPNLVPVFRERYPHVVLRLREATDVEIIAGVAQGSLDVGLVRTPLFGAHGVTLSPLVSENLVLAVPRGHRLEHRQEVDLEELRNEPLILWSREAEPWIRSLIDLSFNKIDITPNVVDEVSQIHTLVALIECGIGIGLVPSVLRRSGSDRVRLVDFLCNGEPVQIGFAIAIKAGSNHRLTADVAQVAIEVLRDSSWHHLLPSSDK